MITIPQEVYRDVANEEGLRLVAYKCAAGKWTIGYGHRLYFDAKGYKITKEQADKWLKEDVWNAALILCNSIPEAILLKLNQNQIRALISFIFNIGRTNWLKPSTALRKLRAGQIKEVALEFPRWVYDDNRKVIPGLVKRRARERKIYES